METDLIPPPSSLDFGFHNTCSGPKNMPPALPLPLHVPRRSKPKLNMRFELWVKMETPPRRRRFFVSTPRKRKDRILHYCRLCSCRYVSRLHRVHVFSLHHVRNVRMWTMRFFFVSCSFSFMRIITRVNLENPNQMTWKPKTVLKPMKDKQTEIKSQTHFRNKATRTITKTTYDKSKGRHRNP